MIDPDQRERARQALLDQPGAAIPGWVEECLAADDAADEARQERLVANIQTLLEHDVPGVEDMTPLDVFFAILTLEREGIIARED